MREKLIELLDKVTKIFRFDAWENTDKIADHLIANGVMVQEWIPVSERLPENDSHKLYAERTVYNVVVYGNVSAAVYGSKVGGNVYDWWVDRRGYVVEGVTHWQPAPLPPVEV